MLPLFCLIIAKGDDILLPEKPAMNWGKEASPLGNGRLDGQGTSFCNLFRVGQIAVSARLLLIPLSHTQDKKRPLGLRVEVFPLTIPRDERGSMLLTSNLPFSKWEVIFKDPMTTAAAIDRLVHHSVVLELNVPSYRAEEAKKRKHKEN